MYWVGRNENLEELLILLLAATLVDQDMLKMKTDNVSVHEMCYIICVVGALAFGMNYEH